MTNKNSINGYLYINRGGQVHHPPPPILATLAEVTKLVAPILYLLGIISPGTTHTFSQQPLLSAEQGQRLRHYAVQPNTWGSTLENAHPPGRRP